MISDLMLRLSQRPEVREAFVSNAAATDLVARYVAGETASSALGVAATLEEHGLDVLLAPIGSESPSREQVHQHVDLCHETVAAARPHQGIALTPLLFGLGHGLAGARVLVREVVRAADAKGLPVILDMGPTEVVDATVQLYRELLGDHPGLGITVQAALKRTPGDLRRIALSGARVRLCAGAYGGPGAMHRRGQQADLAYVRCLRALVDSPAYAMIATHDRRLIPIAEDLIARSGRRAQDYEFQMLYGVRAIEQRRLVDTGRRCRVYIPFGPDWYDYVARRFATHPGRWLRALWRGQR